MRKFIVTAFIVLYFCLCASAMGVWFFSAIYRHGKWSLVKTAEYHIATEMHGSVVYLSDHDKFIYYDLFDYLVETAFALGLIGFVVQEINKKKDDSQD